MKKLLDNLSNSEVATLLPENFLSALTVNTVCERSRYGDVRHHVPSCRSVRSCATPSSSLTLPEILQLNKCFCLEDHIHANFPQVFVALDHADLLVTSNKVLKSNLSRLTSEAAMRKKKAIENLKPYRKNTFPELEDLCYNAHKRASEALRKLDDILKAPSAQGPALECAKKALARDFPVTFDEKQVAVSLYGCGTPPQRLESLMSPFVVHADGPKMVLCCPRFFYDFLQRAAHTSNWRWARVFAYEEPDVSIITTAAVLWCPSDRTSAYADFSAALEAAHSI